MISIKQMSASRSTANLKQGNKYFVNVTTSPKVFIVDANGNIPDTTLGTAFTTGGNAVGNYISLPNTAGGASSGNLYLRDMGETIRVNWAALKAIGGTLATGKAAYPLDTIFRKVQQVSTPGDSNEGVTDPNDDVYYIAFGAGGSGNPREAFNNWADAGLP